MKNENHENDLEALSKSEKLRHERIEELVKKNVLLQRLIDRNEEEISVLKTDIRTEICRKCGHEWKPNSPNPEQCPNCKTKYWYFGPKKYRCAKCGHKWVPRKKDKKPNMCPNCKSKNWDKYESNGDYL